MKLSGLNALLAPAGAGPFTYRGGGWERLTPTTITREGDRGELDVQTFPDEDALCRHLLVRSLAEKPPRPGARRHEPRLSPLPVDDVVAPALRWRRSLPPRTEVVGRGRGLAVLRDTTGLVSDPRRGASQVTVIDVVTGEVRASWLPPRDIGTALVVGDVDEPVVVLSGDGGRTEAFTVEGRPLWSFTRERWEPTMDAGSVVVLQQSIHRVGRSIHAGGDAIALDVLTGAQVWSCASVSRPSFAFWGVPRLGRFFAWRIDGAHLAVLRIDLVTGGTRVVAEGQLPPAHVGSGLTVLEDLMDADCTTGHLTIRTSVDHPSGVGTRLADLVVVAGAGDPRIEVPVGQELLSWSCVPNRLVRGTHDVRCVDLDGSVVWTRPDRGIIRAGAADVVLMETRGVVEAISDDGTTRWERRGSLAVVAHDTIWVSDAADASVLDPATGNVLWTGPAPWSTAGDSARFSGSAHVDDPMVLVSDGSLLQAFGPA